MLEEIYQVLAWPTKEAAPVALALTRTFRLFLYIIVSVETKEAQKILLSFFQYTIYHTSNLGGFQDSLAPCADGTKY